MKRSKSEFDLRLDAFDAEIWKIAFEYAIARAKCLKRHSWPPYLDRELLFSLADCWTKNAIDVAEKNPAAADEFLRERKEK